MVAIESLSFPKKSHRKKVVLPKPSVELAEFFGIMIGDGGINNPWQANITLNSEADREYITYVIKLVESLFNTRATQVRSKSRKAVRIVVSSTTAVDFLVEMGLPRGDKLKSGINIPTWIMKKKEYRAAAVRGLMDTDGCIYTHGHYVSSKTYKNIGLNFSSYSPALISQVKQIFEEYSFLLHSNGQGNGLFLYKEKEITRYFEVFGTSNDRLLSVYKKYMDQKHGGVS